MIMNAISEGYGGVNAFKLIIRNNAKNDHYTYLNRSKSFYAMKILTYALYVE